MLGPGDCGCSRYSVETSKARAGAAALDKARERARRLSRGTTKASEGRRRRKGGAGRLIRLQ